jgi:hypothetical protein
MELLLIKLAAWVEIRKIDANQDRPARISGNVQAGSGKTRL